MSGDITESSLWGGGMGQSDFAISAFEHVLREVEFSRIIELGTGNGNFSVYLSLWCLYRQVDFHTYDLCNWKKSSHSFSENGFEDNRVAFMEPYLDPCFDIGDILEEPLKTQIAKLIAKEGRTVLFCDNGKKKLEFNNYAPYLKPGDIIIVHDWKKEINPPDI